MAKKAIQKIEYPECAQLLLCDALVIDPNSSKPNLYGVFDSFKPAKLPATSRFAVFLKLYGGTGRIPLYVALLDPKGNPVKGASMEIEDFEGKPKQMAKIGGLFNAELTIKGPHKLVVRSGSKTLAESTPIVVEVEAKKK